jgi:hypothetical protein
MVAHRSKNAIANKDILKFNKENQVMRAEMLAVVAAVEKSLALLRRHL